MFFETEAAVKCKSVFDGSFFAAVHSEEIVAGRFYFWKNQKN